MRGPTSGPERQPAIRGLARFYLRSGTLPSRMRARSVAEACSRTRVAAQRRPRRRQHAIPRAWPADLKIAPPSSLRGGQLFNSKEVFTMSDLTTVELLW